MAVKHQGVVLVFNEAAEKYMSILIGQRYLSIGFQWWHQKLHTRWTALTFCFVQQNNSLCFFLYLSLSGNLYNLFCMSVRFYALFSTCVCVWLCECMLVFVCMRLSVWILHACMCVCAFVASLIQKHTHTYTCVCTYTYTFT